MIGLLKMIYWRSRFFISGRINGMPYYNTEGGKLTSELSFNDQANRFRTLSYAVEGKIDNIGEWDKKDRY